MDAIVRDAVIRAVQQNYQETRPLAVMFVVRDEPGLSVRELSRLLNIPKPAATRAIDALEADGLVKRQTPNDRRLTAVHLTPAGEESLRYIVTGDA